FSSIHHNHPRSTLFPYTTLFRSIFENKPEVMNKALVHGGINTAVITAYTILAYIQYKNYPSLEADSILILIIKVLTNAFLILGNFFGGDLILKHRVAVRDE